MSQHLPKSIWLVTLLTAGVLGIWPGIVLAQPNYTWAVALIGWLAFPMLIFQLLAAGHFSTDPLIHVQQLDMFAYPLAMLGYSVYAYWTICRTGVMRKGLIVVVVAAFVSTLITIPVAIITMSINQNVDIVRFLLGYLPALPMHGIILIHLLISAVLGWLIGVGLVLLFRCNIYIDA